MTLNYCLHSCFHNSDVCIQNRICYILLTYINLKIYYDYVNAEPTKKQLKLYSCFVLLYQGHTNEGLDFYATEWRSHRPTIHPAPIVTIPSSSVCVLPGANVCVSLIAMTRRPTVWLARVNRCDWMYARKKSTSTNFKVKVANRHNKEVNWLKRT